MSKDLEKIYVIKIGGNVINDPDRLAAFLAKVASTKGRKIIVHGGGKLVNQLADKLGIVQTMINGRRITDTETLELTAMVYAGLINKKIVATLQANGCNAIGLSGADGNSILAQKRPVGEIDFGWVGDVKEINTLLISQLLSVFITPVFCSITHNAQGQLLNTNADTIASTVATALAATQPVQLVYCFEKKGVLADINDNNSLITSINPEKYTQLLADGIVADGMIPKLENAFAAIAKGVEAVTICNDNDIVEILENAPDYGTTLTK